MQRHHPLLYLAAVDNPAAEADSQINFQSYPGSNMGAGGWAMSTLTSVRTPRKGLVGCCLSVLYVRSSQFFCFSVCFHHHNVYAIFLFFVYHNLIALFDVLFFFVNFC